MEEDIKKELLELKALVKLNEKRFNTLLEFLAEEGIVSHEEFRREMESE